MRQKGISDVVCLLMHEWDSDREFRKTMDNSEIIGLSRGVVGRDAPPRRISMRTTSKRDEAVKICGEALPAGT